MNSVEVKPSRMKPVEFKPNLFNCPPDFPHSQEPLHTPDFSCSTEKLALVIPTLQEARNLPDLLGRVFAALDLVPVRSEVIVVDDNSCDGTLELVRTMARQEPRLRILVRENERGLAGAVLHGWRHTDATMLGVMDADLQHPPELLPQLLGAMMCGSDLAVASRYKTGGSTGDWNAARRFVSSSATWLTRPLLKSKLRVKDPMSGFFIIQRDRVEGLKLQSTGFKLLLELLVRARIRAVTEVSFSFGVRHAGQSKASLNVAVEYARLLWRLYADRRESSAAAPALPITVRAAMGGVTTEMLRGELAPTGLHPREHAVPDLAVPELSSLVLQ